MLGGSCLESGSPDPARRLRLAVAAAVALAGALTGAPGRPLLAHLAPPEQPPRAEPAPPQPPPPKPPPPAHPAEPTRHEGARFFFNRNVGPAKVACADCHLIADPRQAVPDDLIRPGHNLFDAFGRGTWWNGRVTTDCGEAAEVCFKRFMGGEELDGRARTALVLFMKGRAAPVSNPMILHRVPPGRAEVSQGDAARGRDLFRRACAICHSAGDGPAGPDLAASSMTAREIADVVRTGRNRMPLFQGDVLSDADVADLAVYTRSLQPSSE